MHYGPSVCLSQPLASRATDRRGESPASVSHVSVTILPVKTRLTGPAKEDFPVNTDTDIALVHSRPGQGEHSANTCTKR